ncbi:MAG: hypothetical protein KAJ19_14550, partial [Gammaproteobacteria bacterium]|nr:hypothetical protein [Gammaproteobacteria bacterium]
DDPFKINGKIIYSNQTGAPLTEKEWDSIRKDISGYLQDFYVKNGYQLGEESAIMSGILNDMERNGKSIANVDIKRLNTQDTFAEYLKDNDLTQSNYIGMYGDFSQVAQKAVNMSDRVKNDIVDVLQQGLREGKSDWEIEQALREMNKDDGKWSKDWARISKTEIVDVRANMDMTESLDLADGSPVYKKGVGHPNACKLCKRDVINKIVRVLPKAPDEDYKDPNADDFIWPGKSSIGYGANDPVAVITRHPHCACRWADWVPGM